MDGKRLLGLDAKNRVLHDTAFGGVVLVVIPLLKVS